MKISSRLVVVAVGLLASGAAALYQAQSVPDMVASTEMFLASLDAGQKAKVQFDFTDEERQNWFFIPMERNGLTLKEMDSAQQALAHSMMAAALGYKGFMKAATVMSLEQILAGIEGPNGRFNRDPELYYVSVFGEPSTTGTWGWRLEGHHLSVNVTMTDGQVVAATPTFMGSNPAEVREGPRQGLRALGMEEDLGRELLHSLSAEQTERALVDTDAPRDIITGNSREASIEGGPTGLPLSDMNESQRQLLHRLVGEFMNRMTPAVSAGLMARAEAAGMARIHFAWAGGPDRGDPHYFRIHGPTLLIEFDNTQGNANHVHSVFRDLENDWGQDVLLAHYQTSHELETAD